MYGQKYSQQVESVASTSTHNTALPSLSVAPPANPLLVRFHSPSPEVTGSSNSYDARTVPLWGDDTDSFTGGSDEYTGTWTTVSDTMTSSSSNWSSDLVDDAYTPELEQEPCELCQSFHFRGVQYDTIRTIMRPNPRFARTASIYPHALPSESAESLPSVSGATVVGASSSTTSLSLTASSATSSGAVTPPSSPTSLECDPMQAAMRGVELAMAWRHFEDDVDYRAHEWLLEQAGCGRVEIWVTEESKEEDLSRPRVFFPPPNPRH